MAASKSAYHPVAYDPDDDPYAMSYPQGKQPIIDIQPKQSFPQMDEEPAAVHKEGNESEAVAEGKPEADSPILTITEAKTPPTTLPEPEVPEEVAPPRQVIKQRTKHKKCGADPLASSSCRCYLM